MFHFPNKNFLKKFFFYFGEFADCKGSYSFYIVSVKKERCKLQRSFYFEKLFNFTLSLPKRFS